LFHIIEISSRHYSHNLIKKPASWILADINGEVSTLIFWIRCLPLACG